MLTVLLLGLPAVAQEGRPEDVVRAAIEAAGGPDVLKRFPAGRLTAKGTLTAGGSDLPVVVEQTFHVPGRCRTTVRTEVKRRKQELVQVVDGSKLRQTLNGAPLPATDAAAREAQLAVLLLEVGQLTPLLTDKKFVLKSERPAKGADVAAVLVQVKGFPDIRLGFDRKTGHLVRVARKAPDPETGKEVEVEQVLSDHKSFDRLTRPTKVVLYKDGAKALELVTETFTPLEKVDPKEFATD